MIWTYTESDPALMLFTAAVARFNLRFPSGAKILELGCAESDWLDRMHRADPSLRLTGVDARPQDRVARGYTLLQGDAMAPTLFEPESFDWIVLLGSLEHVGLGFYGDPVDEDGDTRAMQNVATWLKPGGFVYFDVPCQPTFRVQPNRHFRSYAPHDVTSRLLAPTEMNHLGRGPLGYEKGVPATVYSGPRLREVTRGYSLPEPNAGTWCHAPMVERVPYWFVAVLAEKVDG